MNIYMKTQPDGQDLTAIAKTATDKVNLIAQGWEPINEPPKKTTKPLTAPTTKTK